MAMWYRMIRSSEANCIFLGIIFPQSSVSIPADIFFIAVNELGNPHRVVFKQHEG